MPSLLLAGGGFANSFGRVWGFTVGLSWVDNDYADSLGSGQSPVFQKGVADSYGEVAQELPASAADPLFR